ncbi:MAG: hypothetical protein HY508_00635 [Acidobacteria bacterium]|nr:hypothetical protein [Acidobacteriota bacterium]
MSSSQIRAREFRKALFLMVLVALAASVALGQFGDLKKKISKATNSTPPTAKTPQGPTPVVTSITPASVPPGWEGQVALTGTNFAKNMKLRLDCNYQSLKIKTFTVESTERAVLDVKVPPEMEESKCVMVLEVPPAPVSETAPTAQGTPQIVQVTGPSLSISESSGLAKALKACFLVEGDIPAMQLMQNLAQAMQSMGNDECKLMVSADSIKYSNKGKVVLDTPASAVKVVEPVLVFGNPSGMFRIGLSSGKFYNFFSSESQGSDNPVWDQIKAKLKM